MNQDLLQHRSTCWSLSEGHTQKMFSLAEAENGLEETNPHSRRKEGRKKSATFWRYLDRKTIISGPRIRAAMGGCTKRGWISAGKLGNDILRSHNRRTDC